MSDSKIHIIKLLMKPNLLVRKLNKDKEQRKVLFAKKEKNRTMYICNLCDVFQNTSLYFGKASFVYKTLKVLGCNYKFFEKT